MEKKVNAIYRTEDYGKFKRLDGNRKVPETRVRKIIDSIKSVGYVHSPILINDRYEVIDGQGRLEALKRLGLPVEYFIQEGIGIEECIALNIYQTNWSIEDYVDSYAETGNNSYIYFQQLMKAYKEMNIRCLYNAVTGKAEVGHKDIKSGKLQCGRDEYEAAMKILDYEERFKECLSRVKGNKDYYYISLGFCYGLSDIDNERLAERMNTMRSTIIDINNMENALKEVERIYNYRGREKVYILTEYKKAMDRRYRWYRGKYMKDTEGGERA